MGEDRGKGNTDGSYEYKKLFTCKKNCAVFVPFTRVKPAARPQAPSASDPSTQRQADRPQLGERITYFTDNCLHGMVLDVKDEGGQVWVQISTDTDERGRRGGEAIIPLESVFKGEVPKEPENMEVDVPPEQIPENLYGLGVNSMVELKVAKGNVYGIIRWIGKVPPRSEWMAGLELEDDSGLSDGTFKKKRYFQCPPMRAMFVRLTSCRPDSRFQSVSANQRVTMPEPEDEESDVEFRMESVLPVTSEDVSEILIGQMKGIQGHVNSCYMDAALFGLFSCSSVLDSMLYKSTHARDKHIQKTLLIDIVKPLRRKGFVEGRHVMKLRQQLQKHGYSHSFTTDEKDPEEFLIVIMHQILNLEPLLKLSAGGKTQESYCYQIFLDQHNLVLPSVQQLLEHSFHSAGLKLAEVPSCLILQMPRFGKNFKMFDKIFPSLQLDITSLLSEGPQQCILCGNQAWSECNDCFNDPVFSSTGIKVFCKTCLSQVHSHPQRQSHRVSPLNIPNDYTGAPPTGGAPPPVIRDTLELFAVLCIETSHYVSFVKHGPSSTDWIFFDSMADREGESDGFNIPEVRACPEVGRYLEMSPSELSKQVPRDMVGVAKRLFCDAYMYLYQSTSMSLYR
ncbi:ubiquitin carboxyl-terminal hydrolase CYLD isoform X2 [Gouania willdenowi]|uniref:ubiquitin carboxyl-terminal hydrolase CYLD isoform X2 n=1 Tax=Gouania willdenowi TaxID=441366 RepID=UPI0010565DD4|nr:ubiquitin carboxyl-terminal hydrolase CYLD-like isoform X2 [Gouania willdenowi]